MRYSRRLRNTWLAVIGIVLSLASINIWGALIWRESEFAGRELAYEYRVTSFRDRSIEDDLSAMGRLGWHVVSCRRATSDNEPLYECIIERTVRPLGN